MNVWNKNKKDIYSANTLELMKNSRKKWLAKHSHNRLGIKHTEESKRKMSLAHKGKKLSNKTKEKISLANKGSKNYFWNGGKTIGSDGYTRFYLPSHPLAVKNYVKEHILVMEEHLGRVLIKGEIVHHINGNKSNNKIENLLLFPNQKAHASFHGKQRYRVDDNEKA